MCYETDLLGLQVRFMFTQKYVEISGIYIYKTTTYNNGNKFTGKKNDCFVYSPSSQVIVIFDKGYFFFDNSA